MGIYLPNMKMPKDCKECPFAGRGKVAGIIELIVCELTNGYRATLINGRMESCPLIEIPPHGDLIDRDALWAKIDKICDRYDAGIITSLTCLQQNLSALRHAPTIIPASGGKENE